MTAHLGRGLAVLARPLLALVLAGGMLLPRVVRHSAAKVVAWTIGGVLLLILACGLAAMFVAFAAPNWRARQPGRNIVDGAYAGGELAAMSLFLMGVILHGWPPDWLGWTAGGALLALIVALAVRGERRARNPDPNYRSTMDGLTGGPDRPSVRQPPAGLS